MAAPDRAFIQSVAAECVARVATDYGHRLDYSLHSLTLVDQVCDQLVADGPLSEQRLDLWSRLAGAYAGEVCLRLYGGDWIEHGETVAISVGGLTAFPFGVAHRVLTGDPFKSVATFVRSIPTVIEDSRSTPLQARRRPNGPDLPHP